jgi:putative PEP-CTERM system histidine kinase
MNFSFFLSVTGAFLCAALAVLALLRDSSSFAHRAFAAGMLALSLEQAFRVLGPYIALAQGALGWHHLGLVATAFLPGAWLLFSLSFGRANYREFIHRWRWVTAIVFAFPLALVAFYGDFFYVKPAPDEGLALLLRLGWSGYLFHLFMLLSAVLVVANLEKTVRESSGIIRWQIKFVALGIGSLFAVRVYTSSQWLLFSTMDTSLEPLNSAAVLVAVMLVVFAIARGRAMNTDIYLSHTLLHNSVTVVIVGLYLLMVGVLAKALKHAGGAHSIALAAFAVFVALLFLTVVLLSNELRERTKRFISRNLKRPQYDYRKVWMTFTERTVSFMDVKQLCRAVAKMVSETFGVPAVTIWLADEAQGRLTLGASTVFSESELKKIRYPDNGVLDLIGALTTTKSPVDLRGLGEVSQGPHSASLRDGGARYCAPLVAGQTMLGVMTLGEGLTKEAFSVEDCDLLKTIADQAASSLLNLRLSDSLLEAKEMEAFQMVSAFFVHDLKNLAGTLSMTLQNFAAHFDNPEFRKDAVATISQSLDKINAMCANLSLLGKKTELKLSKADLNQIVVDALASFNGSLKAQLVQKLDPLPDLLMDPEQLQKVLLNLVLNANDAVGEAYEIRVRTEKQNGWIVLSVSDNGCGMSNEFIAHSLFRPFQSTKKQGLGIGLFQSKKIVEGHQGRIEVESEKDKGTTFKVLLPTK